MIVKPKLTRTEEKFLSTVPENERKAWLFTLDRERKMRPIVKRLLQRDPSLGYTAMIMAGDILSARYAEQLMKDEGLTALEASVHVGSYARLDFLTRQYRLGNLSDDWLLKNWASVWCAADPDDTAPRFINLWKKAYRLNGRKPLILGKALPRTSILYVYRGQDVGAAKVGIAWTLDYIIADKFARGMGLRQPDRRGEILSGWVRRNNVMGYITERGESEIIALPQYVTITSSMSVICP